MILKADKTTYIYALCISVALLLKSRIGSKINSPKSPFPNAVDQVRLSIPSFKCAGSIKFLAEAVHLVQNIAIA